MIIDIDGDGASESSLSPTSLTSLPGVMELPNSFCSPTAVRIHRMDLRSSETAVSTFLKTISRSDCIGIAVGLDDRGLSCLSVASQKTALSITIPRTRAATNPNSKLQYLLNGAYSTLAGFELPYVVLHLWRDLRLHSRGMDLSTAASISPSKPLSPIQLMTQLFSMTGWRPDRAFQKLWGSNEENDICLRAWLSACMAEALQAQHMGIIVMTKCVSEREIECLAKLALQIHQLDASKPNTQENEFTEAVMDQSNAITIRNSRYKNRVRASDENYVVLVSDTGREVRGRAVATHGKTTTVAVHQAGFSGTITGITVVGKESLTRAEHARNEFVLHILTGTLALQDRLLNRLFFLPDDFEVSAAFSAGTRHRPGLSGLNDSQSSVASAIVVGSNPIVVVQGPPGTGKTSTIAISVECLLANDSRASVWIVAQSNVGVKNIAERLARQGVDFKLLVSAEFYVEWHEHLYQEIEKALVRTDEIAGDAYAFSRIMAASRVILCTLSTLSNPVLVDRNVFYVVPVKKLIIDEASQINIFEYMHLFEKFQGLEQVVFFGDHKQCESSSRTIKGVVQDATLRIVVATVPPYGKNVAPSIQSVFELSHFRKYVYFLNIQYRMPTPLGEFISEFVYQKKLRSEHKITSPDCIAFIDVYKGEERKVDTSWTNAEEVQTIVHLVNSYYRHREFCVITPYDAQRATIERALKAANLPWENVFNIDSFQGNESEYVLVSVVRTSGPGFLNARERVNVMLTRCKKGMVIVSNRKLLTFTAAQDTLIGELANYWMNLPARRGWVDWREVAQGRADMPGVPGPFRWTMSSATPQSVSAGRGWEAQQFLSIAQQTATFDALRPNFIGDVGQENELDELVHNTQGMTISPPPSIAIESEWPSLPSAPRRTALRHPTVWQNSNAKGRVAPTFVDVASQNTERYTVTATTASSKKRRQKNKSSKIGSQVVHTLL